jgi:hypothetical protein
MKTQLFILGSIVMVTLSVHAQDWATVYSVTLNDMTVHNAAIYGTTSGSGPVKSTNGTDWETIDNGLGTWGKFSAALCLTM